MGRVPDASGGGLGDRLGRQARERAPMSRGKRLAWIAFGILLLGLLLAQALGWTRSPVADRVREHRERQEREQQQTPPAMR